MFKFSTLSWSITSVTESKLLYTTFATWGCISTTERQSCWLEETIDPFGYGSVATKLPSYFVFTFDALGEPTIIKSPSGEISSPAPKRSKSLPYFTGSITCDWTKFILSDALV